MKKHKLLLAILAIATVTLSGCASSFKESIGYVTKDSLIKNSFLTYEETGISDDIAMLDLYLQEFNTEYSSYATDQENFTQEKVWSKEIKDNIIENAIIKLKSMLVLNSEGKKMGVKLSDADNNYIKNTAKTQLGQTYRNLIVEYLKGKGVNLTEELMIEYLTMVKFAEVARSELIQNNNSELDYGNLVSYIDITVPLNAGGHNQEAKITAESVKDKIEKGEEIDEIVTELGLNKIDGIDSENYPSKTFSEDIKKQVVSMEVGDVGIFEFKSGDSIVGYHVVKILDKNSDETKKIASQQIAAQAKADATLKKINEWTDSVNVNKEKFNNVMFNLDRSFWDSYKDIVLRPN